MRYKYTLFLFLSIVLLTNMLLSQDVISEAWINIPQNTSNLSTIAIDYYNKRVATVLQDNSIQVFSLEDGQATVKIMGHERFVKALALNSNGKLLASGDSDGIVLVWSLANGEQVFRFAKHTRSIQTLTFSNDGKWLASAGSDNIIFVWDMENGFLLYQLEGHSNEIIGLTIWPDKSLLLSTSRDNTTKVWKLLKREDSAEELAKRGREYKKKGDYNNAITNYQAAVKMSPANMEFQYELATNYALRLKNLAEDDPQYQKDVAEMLQCLGKVFQAGFQKWIEFNEDFKEGAFTKDTRFQTLVSTYKPIGNISIRSKPVSFDILEEGGKGVARAYEIWINNEKITPQNLFLPGYAYNMIIKFKEYQTVQKYGFLGFGKDDLTISVPLKKLVKYDFFTKEVEKTFDGIKYPLKYYIDGQEIEPHLLDVVKRGVNFYHSVRVPQEAKELRSIAGFLYNSTPFISIKNSFIQAEKIDVLLLIKHLEYLAKQNIKEGYRISMIALEQMVRSYYWNSKLKYAPMDDINELINFIESWGFENAADQERARMLVDSINSLLGQH